MRPVGILYLDDTPQHLDSFRKSLADTDYEVWTSSNLEDALRRLRDNAIDLVVCDYHVGEITGDVCLETMREIAPSHVRFFLYTVDNGAFRRHREMGFDGVLMLKDKDSARKQIDVIARAVLRAREA